MVELSHRLTGLQTCQNQKVFFWIKKALLPVGDGVLPPAHSPIC